MCIIDRAKPGKAVPVMELNIVMPSKYEHSVRKSLKRRNLRFSIDAFRGKDRSLYYVGKIDDLLGVHDEIAHVTSNKAIVTMRFSHYRPEVSMIQA